MTRQNNGNAYFLYMANENETKIPAEISIKSQQPAAGGTVTLLGYDKPLKWVKSENGFKVTIPEDLQHNPPCDFVWTLKVSHLQKR